MLRSPALTGSVAPSSDWLARTLSVVVPTGSAGVVVELGAGTGAVSGAIGRRLPAGGRHLAVEIDPQLVCRLRRAHPQVEVVQGDAHQLVDLLTPYGVDRADAVVCGLPWTLFAPESQRTILDQIRAVLTPAGGFTTFSYLHAVPLAGARRFRRLLLTTFDEVVITRTVWWNMPPAYVYVCRRPIAPAGRG